ncbi:ATPase [Methanocaldococcus infernus ME]|uniref:ATPase n=1 Tax=Methanocaldococcus infernus (strain DSM 11812 / JCM 15783 / ME) TaxID=573063 RepID=D5VTC7_METIM|nr:ATP-binding protein [Methanocaldococcus infernus]ADG13830.1 ATPase [Methanocaldococcus infernus ME]
MKFFNREKEIREILSILEFEPNFIYFIYGPINSGKTALINEVINKLDEEYVVFYFDLREIFISKYEDFIEVLFEEYEEDKNPIELVKSLIKDSSILFGIPTPKNTLETLLSKKKPKNVFKYITNILLELRKEGKQPIIILDELQKIGDLKINGFLIYELFNYFISLTKHKHLCHVFCLSSDSLFIEKVYSEAMLKGRADYILVDDFDKETALKFMDFLAENILNKKLSNEEKELIYSYVGGKPVLIINVINKLKTKNLDEVLNYLLNVEISDIMNLLVKAKNNKEKVVNALKLFKDRYEIDAYSIEEDIKELLVKRNILFLDPIKRILRPQSFLTWRAIKILLESKQFFN